MTRRFSSIVALNSIFGEIIAGIDLSTCEKIYLEMNPGKTIVQVHSLDKRTRLLTVDDPLSAFAQKVAGALRLPANDVMQMRFSFELGQEKEVAVINATILMCDELLDLPWKDFLSSAH